MQLELRSIDIPASVKEIGNNAFDNCLSLNTIVSRATDPSLISYGSDLESIFNGMNTAIMIAAVVGSSLFLYLSSPDAKNSSEMGWCYERMGLVWGLLLFLSFAKIVEFMNSRWLLKTLALCRQPLV